MCLILKLCYSTETFKASLNVPHGKICKHDGIFVSALCKCASIGLWPKKGQKTRPPTVTLSDNLKSIVDCDTLLLRRALKPSDDVRIHCNYKINQVFFIFNTRKLFSEKKRLPNLNLSVTYPGEPSTRPLSCTTP